jgi:hypothetical protein
MGLIFRERRFVAIGIHCQDSISVVQQARQCRGVVKMGAAEMVCEELSSLFGESIEIVDHRRVVSHGLP